MITLNTCHYRRVISIFLYMTGPTLILEVRRVQREQEWYKDSPLWSPSAAQDHLTHSSPTVVMLSDSLTSKVVKEMSTPI